MKNDTHQMIVRGLAAAAFLLLPSCQAPTPRVAQSPAPAPVATAKLSPTERTPASAPAKSGSAAQPVAVAPASQPASRSAIAASRPAAIPIPSVDPAGYMRYVGTRAQSLTAYTARLIRTERRGLLFKHEHGPENIMAWFRQEPFSVRFEWLDKDSKQGEAAYVSGKHDNKVRFVPRIWVPPLLPGINAVEVGTPVALGEALNPLTDFGLRRMMERAVANLDRAGPGAAIRYVERKLLPEVGVEVHHIHVDFPEDQNVAPRQDMFIDCDRHLPVGAVLRKMDGTLHGAYYYADLDTSVSLTDPDFLLKIERKDAAK